MIGTNWMPFVVVFNKKEVLFDGLRQNIPFSLSGESCYEAYFETEGNMRAFVEIFEEAKSFHKNQRGYQNRREVGTIYNEDYDEDFDIRANDVTWVP